MMPDLGRYAATVLGAYGAALVLLVGLVVLSLWQGARTRRALEAVEARAKRGN
jgi:heme exporter protein D